MPAQGYPLEIDANFSFSPVRASQTNVRQPFVSPFQGLCEKVSPNPGRCPGLICACPFGAEAVTIDFLRTNLPACRLPQSQRAGSLWLWALKLAFLFLPLTYAEIPPEFRIKRELTFEFTEEPKVARKDNQYLITFTSKAYCDATVAIENAS
ncbi:MAG: hypothetical protein QF473_25515, partial [Planctomycetota bacterium]|nr:hypothetical protein [Planctomycetota bacterium]